MIVICSAGVIHHHPLCSFSLPLSFSLNHVPCSLFLSINPQFIGSFCISFKSQFVSLLSVFLYTIQLLAQPMAVPGVEAYTASLGNVEEAFRILDRMYERKINPNIFTLTSLMKTCVMREDWGRARELLAMGDRYLTPLHGVDNNGINRGANAAGVDNTRNNGLVMVNQLATLRGSLVIGLCQMSMSSDIGTSYSI